MAFGDDRPFRRPTIAAAARLADDFPEGLCLAHLGEADPGRTCRSWRRSTGGVRGGGDRALPAEVQGLVTKSAKNLERIQIVSGSAEEAEKSLRGSVRSHIFGSLFFLVA